MFLQEQIKDIILSPRRESCPSSKHFFKFGRRPHLLKIRSCGLSCAETEPESSLRAPGRCVEHSATWGNKDKLAFIQSQKDLYQSLFIALVRTVTGGGSGYAAILAHAGGVLYGMELGSVILKRIGFFCFPIKLSTHTPRYLPLSMTDSVTLHCITLTLLGSTIKLQEPS